MSLDEVEDFFFDDGGDYNPWRPGHTISQSPCVPIISIKRTHWCLWYYCDLHRGVEHDSLVTLEHHMKYKEPEKHKKVILEKLRARKIDKANIIKEKIDQIFLDPQDMMLTRARKRYLESFEERIKGFSQLHQTRI